MANRPAGSRIGLSYIIHRCSLLSSRTALSARRPPALRATRPAYCIASCHVESGTIFGKGTIPEPSTPHIGKGVALVAQAAAPVYPRVYRRSAISDSTNDHSSFYATLAHAQ